MRVVVDASGTLIFASPAVGWFLGTSGASLAGKPASAALSIVASRDSKHQSLGWADMQSGFYEVALLRRNRDPQLVLARIDRVDNHLVVWLDPDGKLGRAQPDDFSREARAFTTFVTAAPPAPEKRPAPAVPAPISLADGELRHFLNLTSDLMGVYHRDGRFGRVNATFNRITGFSDAELRTFPFLGLIIPEDREAAGAALQRVLQAPREQELRADCEGRIRCKDGALRWIQWALKTSGDYTYIVGRDVTDVKRHELELERREAQLSEAQKIGRMGHWSWEAGAREMEWSDQIYAIFGAEKGRFSPTLENVRGIVLHRDYGKTYHAFQKAFASGKDYEVSFRLRLPGGDIRYIHSEGRCKLDPATGRTTALFGIMQDVTERTLHERDLRAAKESAESAYASKTRFLANMSHELRTPLNAIIGFSEMIQSQLLGPVGNAKYLGYVGDIHRAGRHLLDLINDILDMSKIEVGKYELHVEELNVGKLASLALNMVEGRAHDAGVRLVTDEVQTDVHVVADRRALMQVMLNLLSNAVKFTQRGGAVTVRCRHVSGDRVEISVIDTGIGIPPEKLGAVTQPFEQVDSELTRKHEGSGLGLAITKDLVELHGGRLLIESALGIGTTVTVLLPERQPQEAVAG